MPVFKNLRLTVAPPGLRQRHRRTARRAAGGRSSAPRKAFPHAEEAIAAFQPNLNFARAYTPDIFNGFGKLGQVTGYYDGNGHYARVQFATSTSSTATAAAASWNRSRRAEQYEAFGASAAVRRPCPGGGTQPAPDGSNPFTEPPFAGSGVNPSECNPADVPPGP